MQEQGLQRQQDLTDISHFPDGQELVITAVERQPRQKGRYLISFGEYTLSIHEDVMIKYRMLKGNVFTKQELEDIVVADEKQRAYVQALKYLERKQRTRKELADRLREKEYTQAVIEHALQRLEQESLINDELYAKQSKRRERSAAGCLLGGTGSVSASRRSRGEQLEHDPPRHAT